jgi:hypothetical protein
MTALAIVILPAGEAFLVDQDGRSALVNRWIQAKRDVRLRQDQIMKFRSQVEPPEPMRGLEVPQAVVEALGGGKRPPVTITITGH